MPQNSSLIRRWRKCCATFPCGRQCCGCSRTDDRFLLSVKPAERPVLGQRRRYNLKVREDCRGQGQKPKEGNQEAEEEEVGVTPPVRADSGRTAIEPGPPAAIDRKSTRLNSSH